VGRAVHTEGCATAEQAKERAAELARRIGAGQPLN